MRPGPALVLELVVRLGVGLGLELGISEEEVETDGCQANYTLS